MAGNKYIGLVAGRLKEIFSIQSSAGAGDASKIPALDTSGRLDVTMMPVGVVADNASIATSESLAAGDIVNVWNNSSMANVRKADATAEGKEAVGFVLSAFTDPTTALVFFEGTITGLSGLTIGARYYLSAATPGAITTTPPAAANNVVQFIGVALSATTLSFEPENAVTVG